MTEYGTPSLFRKSNNFLTGMTASFQVFNRVILINSVVTELLVWELLLASLQMRTRKVKIINHNKAL
jgi:hypothetical protein